MNASMHMCEAKSPLLFLILLSHHLLLAIGLALHPMVVVHYFLLENHSGKRREVCFCSVYDKRKGRKL